MWSPDIELHASGWPAALVIAIIVIITLDSTVSLVARIVGWLAR